MFDVIIIGSGPAGVTAARECAAQGLKIAIVDAGQKSEAALPPQKPFSALRAQKDQYFFRMPQTNDAHSAGAQLTPARLHMLSKVAEELPVQGPFVPFQTLAEGGLSAGWGAACFTYTAEMLQKAGLSPDLDYKPIADHIGVSGPEESLFCDVAGKQPTLDLDSNATKILEETRDSLPLEPASLAVLSQDKGARKANPYLDLDFWSDHGKSVYRAQWDLEDLAQQPNVTLISNAVALKFRDAKDAVTVDLKNLTTQAFESIQGKLLFIAAGAFGSYRLCANSLGAFNKPNPYLCNPYAYVPSINLKMLGRKGTDRRHSLSQLFGEYGEITLQFYSYRSLLLQRLIDQTPVNPWLARQFWRTTVESLVITGCHFPDSGAPGQTLAANPLNSSHLPTLEFQNHEAPPPCCSKIMDELVKLECIPMWGIKTKPGASIHYAGTIPVAAENAWAITQDENNKLRGTQRVYVCDNSGWAYLPSRGPTFTIMANSRAITLKALKTWFAA